jgi:surface polysaccharide O-acyltransferase-like enzyme
MKLMHGVRDPNHRESPTPPAAVGAGRDGGIDTMRGVAILMVIAIHSLQQPLGQPWQVMLDAALRPCVPIFLFASGYLTALSGRVPLFKRLKAAVIPYAIAFVAAYVYMSLQNPEMDHRIVTTVARFVLAYVFVYYYVFVYVGCTIGLCLVVLASTVQGQLSGRRLIVILMLSISFGLIVGSYLDPLLARLGYADSLVEETRMRDVPFWFCFAALGALIARTNAGPVLCEMRRSLIAIALVTYAIYAAVRFFGIGDAAAYDSVAFFGYATLLCIVLLGFNVRSKLLAALGTGSYFIYLWHIFIVMILRDHAGLRPSGAIADSAITYAVTVVTIVVALLAVRRIAPPRVVRWVGA